MRCQAPSPSNNEGLKLQDIALVLGSKASLANAEWVSGHRSWLDKGVNLVIASNITETKNIPRAGDRGGEFWVSAADDESHRLALAPFQAAGALANASVPFKWMLLVHEDTLVNLFALHETLVGWDHTLPYAVTDCLTSSQGASASCAVRAPRCAPCHHLSDPGNGGLLAGCPCTPQTACASIAPAHRLEECLHGHGLRTAIHQAGGVALSWGLLRGCYPFNDISAINAIVHTALLPPPTHAAVCHGRTAPLGGGFAVLGRLLWHFGVAVTTPWPDERSGRSSFGRVHMHSSRGDSDRAGDRTEYVDDLASLANAASAGKRQASIALRHSVSSAPGNVSAADFPKAYEAITTAWKTAGSASHSPACGEDVTAFPGHSWEDGVLLLQIDSRPPDKMPAEPFAVDPKKFEMPIYPAWSNESAGFGFTHTLGTGDNYSSGYIGNATRYIYTRDPKQFSSAMGGATLNELVASAFGWRYRRVTWRPPPEGRWGTWTKTDFYLELMKYALFERCGRNSSAFPGSGVPLLPEEKELVRSIIPPGGLKLIMFLDGDAYIRDPMAFRAQITAFANNGSALMAYAEEPHIRLAYWLRGSPQFINTGWYVVKPTVQVLDFFQRVWDCPHKIKPWWASDLLTKYSHEQGCHNYISFQDEKLLEPNTQIWPVSGWNTPAGKIVRHCWVVKDAWWEIIAEDMVAIAVWHVHYTRAATLYVGKQHKT